MATMCALRALATDAREVIVLAVITGVNQERSAGTHAFIPDLR